jgi:hypothetical protein
MEQLTMNIIPLHQSGGTEPANSIRPRRRRGGRVWAASYLPRAAEVAALYQTKQTRSAICRVVKAPGGRVIWDMILQGIDAGFITANNIGLQVGTVSLRLLFPQTHNRSTFFTSRYNLMNPRHRDFVMNVVWPIALANKEAVAADPARLEQLVADRPKVEQPKPETRPAVRRVLSNAPAIVLFGQTFWPRGDVLDYSYDECRAAARFFRDLLHLCDASTALSGPKSKAMGIRASTRAIQRFGNRNVLMLVDAIANAMEANPDGICEWPHRPVDGNW